MLSQVNPVVPWYLNPLFLTPVVGLIGVMIGGFITAGSAYFLEKRRHEWARVEKKHLMFAEKRLNALQNAIQLCDFLDSIRSTFPVVPVSREAQADWVRIRRENGAQGALMPKSVQKELKGVLDGMAFEAYPPGAPGEEFLPFTPPTDELRRLCLESIESEYENI
jgi:hypothetical protein